MPSTSSSLRLVLISAPTQPAPSSSSGSSAAIHLAKIRYKLHGAQAGKPEFLSRREAAHDGRTSDCRQPPVQGARRCARGSFVKNHPRSSAVPPFPSEGGRCTRALREFTICPMGRWLAVERGPFAFGAEGLLGSSAAAGQTTRASFSKDRWKAPGESIPRRAATDRETGTNGNSTWSMPHR